LVQPATKCGYRFEDDELVDEMLGEVEGERGALPLLAFAMSRLWEKRDRESGQLTRQAYHDIGGVGGALARHAEATLESIGVERQPIVRELFRNLVTAEGTRAVREWGDLLSVFEESQRESAEEILRDLIDARLLTSYEIQEEGQEPTRRVEIIHESLLANWPRLVRWQTQDEEGAQLRDELRHAARSWDEHGRQDDRLWTGTAFREFQLWSERYPGGLTDTEEAFGSAMTALAGRHRRRRRIAVAAIITVLIVGLTVVGSFWQRSVRETRRAEAATLLSQAQVELGSYPSAAIAFATASIELSDSPEARRLALRALWKGPTAFVVNEVNSWNIAFSPDGRWLVQTTDEPPHLTHLINADGSDEKMEDVHGARAILRIGPESEVFATLPRGNAEPWALWSASEKRLLAKGRSGWPENTIGIVDDLTRRRMLLMLQEDNEYVVDAVGFDGATERIGKLPFDPRSSAICSQSNNNEWFAVADGQDVFVIEFGDHSLSESRRLGHLESIVLTLECDPLGRFVAARSEDGQIHLLDLAGGSPPRVFQGPSVVSGIRITPDGSLLEARNREKSEQQEIWIWSLENEAPTLLRHIELGMSGATGNWRLNPIESQIVSILNPDPKIRLWSLQAPADAEPVIMQRGDTGILFRLAFHPRGQWLAVSGSMGLSLWPVARPYPTVINRYHERNFDLLFGPDGRWLSTSSAGTVYIWRLEGDALPPAQVLHQAHYLTYGIAASPDGKKILLGTHRDGPHLISLSGEPPVDLPGDVDTARGVAISPDGRFAAAAGAADKETSHVIRVWDLATHEQVEVFNLGDVQSAGFIRFTRDGHLLSGNSDGLLRWNLETGDSESLFEAPVDRLAISSDTTRVLFMQPDRADEGLRTYGRAVVLDLGSGSTTFLKSHGDRVTAVAMDGEGRFVVTGDEQGVVRVGPITGGEPHLLLGNPHEIWALAVDPLGRWIASSSGTEVRLWPMPDLSEPPLHTLPREELIAKLKTLTNLRVVRDEDSPTGWKLEVGPFPGWETVPTW